MPSFTTEIEVVRQIKEGWSLYTCSNIPGLFISSNDDQKAYEDLPRAIQLLFQLDYDAKVSVTVTHKLSYNEFVEQVAMADSAQEAVERRTNALYVDDVIPFTITKSEAIRPYGSCEH